MNIIVNEVSRRCVRVLRPEASFCPSLFMKCVVHLFRVTAFVSFVTGLLLIAGSAQAASVGPAGYTNSFDLQPAVEDWATANKGGASNDAYDMDSDVITNTTASVFTNQTTANANNPPGVLANATWSSSGLYLQTRPTSA